MILIDFSQTVIANAWIQCATPIDRNRLRLNVLASIRKIKTEHACGEVVIACESDTYWRHTFFPYYKARRDKTSPFWTDVLAAKEQLAEEFKSYFKVIKVKGAEADDVIGVLAEEVSPFESILIVSADRDFYQLQRYPGVTQCTTKTYLTCADPIRYLAEHIIHGDVGDGIPNILSPDNSLVAHIRQKAIRKKDIETLIKIRHSTYYKRNETLIDLQRIPYNLKGLIIEEYLK